MYPNSTLGNEKGRLMGQDKDIETLNTDFSTLTEKNKKNIIEMTKFLVLTQNTIVPELLNDKADVPPSPAEKEKAE
jgi:hypothetical protein